MSTQNDEPGSSKPQRLVSIDALRGFDMLWILGGGSLFKEIAELCGQPKLAEQMEHVEWSGFRFYDLIFPTFLFIVGVVLPFSLSQYTSLNDPDQPRSHAWSRIIRFCVMGWRLEPRAAGPVLLCH